jgi:Arc/MetJ-type ribon-helix-helix transcriptional regulator
MLETQFLTVRLSEGDAALVARLHRSTGESKSDLVKRALRSLAEREMVDQPTSLHELGETVFGKRGDASRQSADIKSVVASRILAKRSRG